VTTVGYVGADVPRELIPAPLRLRALPDVDLAEADAILGPGVDEWTRRVFAGLLDDRYPIDAVVVSRLTDAAARAYAALRALGREPYLLDLVHAPSSERYDRDRIAELAATFGGGADMDETRRLAAELRVLRRDGRVAGSAAFRALLAAGNGDDAPLRALLADPTPPIAERTVFLCGSDHDSPKLYDAIERLGWNVIGEDHTWGETCFDGLAGDDLAARYHRGSACFRRGEAERAAYAKAAGAELILVWLRRGDEGRLWGVPHLRGAHVAVVRDAEHANLAQALA
jgi:hypothetical protein